MDKLDLSGLPSWVVILIAIMAVFSPIILAWIGAVKARKDAPAPAPPAPSSTQIEVTTPWLVQNILEMKMNGEKTLSTVEALTKAASDLSVQVNTLVALLKRSERRH